MKKGVKFLIFLLISFIFIKCSAPVQMQYTDSERKWNDSIEKVYPYNIMVGKGWIINGIPDCGDNSFTIYVNYQKTNDSTNLSNKIKMEALDIVRTYSRIRDYKDCVQFIYIQFTDTIRYQDDYEGKYDILKDKIQTGIKVY